jgi:phosphatidylserine/phosphatidylglycerophosphate/cardiolipin synthase-like enzyme
MIAQSTNSDADDVAHELAREVELLQHENERLSGLLSDGSAPVQQLIEALKNAGRENLLLRERNAALMVEKNDALRRAKAAERKAS